MNLLALETSTEACSVALLHAGELRMRSELAPRRHAGLLLPMAAALLAEAGLATTALDGIAVGAGPGAFTGVRLAVAAAQGLALALGRPVVTVSSLAALAMQAPGGAEAILAVIDARMGEVYAGAFRRDAGGLVAALGPESVGPAARLELPVAASWTVLGSGWGAHADALRARLPEAPVAALAERFPQAAEVARLAAPRLARGEGVPAHAAQPVYLRDKVALTLAEQGAVRRAP